MVELEKNLAQGATTDDGDQDPNPGAAFSLDVVDPHEVPLHLDVEAYCARAEGLLINLLRWSRGPLEWTRGRRIATHALRRLTVELWRFVELAGDAPEPVEDAAKQLKDAALDLRAQELASGHPRDPTAGDPPDQSILACLRYLDVFRWVHRRHDPRTDPLSHPTTHDADDPPDQADKGSWEVEAWDQVD